MSDLIKREDAINVVEEIETMYLKGQIDLTYPPTIKRLKSIPSAERKGEWIDEADKYDASFGIHDYRCSNCNSYADEYICGHEWYTADKPNFCPHCGADMREREGE